MITPSQLFDETNEVIGVVEESIEEKQTLEEEISHSVSLIDGAFRSIQEKILSSNKKELSVYKGQVLEVYNLCNDIKENQLPRYKKEVLQSNLRTDQKLKDLKQEFYETLEKRLEETKETIKVYFREEVKDLNKLRASVVLVESYIKENSSAIVKLREEVFAELREFNSDSEVNQIVIQEKLDEISKEYETLSEGLLNEPPSTDNSDPLTPMDQNFVTLDQLQQHYKVFVNRVTQQLATLGGGGEVRLEFLDDIDRNSAKVNGRFLKYDSSVGRWVGATAGAGSQNLDETLGLGNTSSTGMSVGVITASSFVKSSGTSSQFLKADGSVDSSTYLTSYTETQTLDDVLGLGNTSATGMSVGVITATNIIASTATFSGNVSIGGTLTYEDVTNVDSLGVGTFRNGIIVNTGTATTALLVNGDARITGIVTVGPESITIDGVNNQVVVGAGVTLYGNSGVVSATSYYGDGSNLTGVEHVISVKDYGAKGDGSTDDYSAITSAIAAAAGKTLVFPKGTYSVTQTIIFDQSDSIIRGQGQVTITMPDNIQRKWSVANVGKSTVGVANDVPPVERVLIENITFDFNNNRRTTNTGGQPSTDDAFNKNACTIANAKYVTMRNCRFLNGWRHCLDVSTPIKKTGIGTLTSAEKLLFMPVLPNIGGTEIFGAQYITLDGCYFKGGGDDNLTTHYCSDVLITNCWSETPYGGYGTGGGNHNGFEIDDGSRNITISNSTAFKCMSGIEVKAHDYAPPPYNVTIDAVRIINCTSAIEIHHSNWEGPISGNSKNAFNKLGINTIASRSKILAPGTDQEVLCFEGISPIARNVSVSNVQVIAPTTISYFVRDSSNNYTGVTTAPQRCFEVGGYEGVLVNNITFNDGRRDVALSDVDGYSQPTAFGNVALQGVGVGRSGDIGLIHLHDGCRNVSFSNVQVTGFGTGIGVTSGLTEKVFNIQSTCFDGINCSNLTVVDGPNKIVEASGAGATYFGSFRGIHVRSSVGQSGPALDSTNRNLRFEQPDIVGYTTAAKIQELVLEKSTSTPGSGRGKGSVHVNETTGVVKVKTTGRDSSDWNCLGTLAWARYTGSNEIIRKQFNIASIVRNSTGNYTVTLSDDLVFASSNDFCAIVTSSQNITKVSNAAIDGDGHASFNIETESGIGTSANSGFINIVVYGETSN